MLASAFVGTGADACSESRQMHARFVALATALLVPAQAGAGDMNRLFIMAYAILARSACQTATLSPEHDDELLQELALVRIAT